MTHAEWSQMSAECAAPRSRRQFLKDLAKLGGALALGSTGAVTLQAAHALSNRMADAAPARHQHLPIVMGASDLSLIGQELPAPALSGIEHIIVLMMENRSFDHFLGWLPHAEGRQAGLTYSDKNGVAHPTYRLAPDFQGCAFHDPDHSYAGQRLEYNGGACDGWLRASTNDLFCIGYYTQSDLPFLGQAAPAWTVCDHYHCAIMGPTFPNRIYQHAGQTDRISNTFTVSTLPTIWDRLAAQSLTGRYYYTDVPFLGLWGGSYTPISRSIAAFYTDCAAGTLPQVAFVDGSFSGELNGSGNDDHPHTDIRRGEAFMNQIYQAVTSSPQWSSTVLVINFDESGGFYEHVPPSSAPITPTTAAAGDTDGLLGFRVPCLVISPWSRRSFVVHKLYDHTSLLRMIEWRWNLQPLTIRTAAANNLAEVLDFAHPTLAVPTFSVPADPGSIPCP